MNLIYHKVKPENASSSYTEFKMVDFVLKFPGRKLLSNSIRLNADLIVKNAAGNFLTNQNVYLDYQVGAHSFFDTITTNLQNVGQIENVLEYPRFIKQKAIASSGDTDYFQASKVCELRGPDQMILRNVIRGVVAQRDATASDANNPIDFAVKPDFCLNRMVGGDNTLSFRKSGTIRISVRLARNNACLYGPEMTVGTCTYSLENLSLTYQTVPDDGKDSKLRLPNTVNIKTTISSNSANISARVPAVCRSMSATVIAQSHENIGIHNNLDCMSIPQFKKLQFLFSDSTNKIITYEISDQLEILHRFIQSVNGNANNQCSLLRMMHDKAYGIGIDFRGFVDLSKQKFNIQVSSGLNSANPYTLYMFFNGVNEL